MTYTQEEMPIEKSPLKILMAERGVWVKDLMTAAKLSRPTVSRHVRGIRSPNVKHRSIYAALLRVSVDRIDEMFNGVEADQDEESPALRNTGSVRRLYDVPLYDLSMPASHWAELVDAEEVTDESGRRDTIDQGLFRVRIHGDCMEPKWHDGEIVEFRIWRHDSPFPTGRDVAITDSNHMTTFKHLVGMSDDGDTIILRAHNQRKYPGDIHLPKTMMARMAVAVGAFDPRE